MQNHEKRMIDSSCDFATAPWLDLPASALGAAADIPTMLSMEEQKLYYWLAAHAVSGAGAFVDLGAFAGGSTARLAAGLATAGLATRIHAYDRFTMAPHQQHKYLADCGLAPLEGRDSLPAVRRLLAPWGERIALHKCDIAAETWRDGPIELLVVDAAKSAELADVIAERFMTALLPGGFLVQQDFLHAPQPWLPAQMELLAGYFEPVAHAAPTTMVFRCINPPVTPPRLSGRADEDILRLVAAAAERYRDWGLAGRIENAAARLRRFPGARDARLLRGRPPRPRT